jgi:hypothetical protein
MDTALRVMRKLDGVVESAAVLGYPFLKLNMGVESLVGGSVDTCKCEGK